MTNSPKGIAYPAAKKKVCKRFQSGREQSPIIQR